MSQVLHCSIRDCIETVHPGDPSCSGGESYPVLPPVAGSTGSAVLKEKEELRQIEPEESDWKSTFFKK